MSQDGTDTEAQLVERARSGDETAFQELCTRYEDRLQARLRHWIVGPMKRKVSLADVLQEAYITAHSRLDDFENRGDGAFGAWLTKIAELKAREAIRRYVQAEKRDVRRETTRGGRPDTANFPGREPSPSEIVMGRERAADLQRAIGELSDASQQVLHLVRVEGLTLQDAALVMNRSYEATKKLYGRALAPLAKRMDVDRKGRPEK